MNREPWEDHYISCEELQNYPERVFAQGNVDLGSGMGSPNAIDYNCDGGLLSMEFLGNIYAISNQVRSESLTIKCSGSISYLHRRSFYYNLLKAGLAPEIFASNWRTRHSIQDMVDYFKSWAHYSPYNFDLYNSFWEEYREVKPILASHYMANFNLSEEKALEYADNALNIYLNWAVGSFSFDDRPGTLQIIEVLSDTNVSVKSLENDLGTHLLSSNNLDKALKVALLYQKQKSILEFLLQKGARIDKGDESALFFALRNREHVEYLLGKGANVNYENGFGKTVLFYAIQNNDIEMVQLLLENNADVNHHYKSEEDIRDLGLSFRYCGIEHFKRTPLMHAAQNGNVEIMKLLLKYGADIDAQDQVGYNAMDYAVLGENAENVNYLSSMGLQGNK